MSENRWLKRAKLLLLSFVGLSAVSIPFTAALVLSVAGADSPPASPRCSPTKGYYALTFDDGPFTHTTERLLGALEQAGAVATFFDVGERAAAHPELVDRQRAAGEVANHSYTHAHLPDVSRRRRVQELSLAAAILDPPNAFVRPPYGETSPGTDADMRAAGLVPVYWTTDTFDWQDPPVDVIVKRALRVQPGGIILLHDGRENTVRAVPRIVSGLRARGMCPGLLARSDKTVVSAYRGTKFNVIAVRPS